jgi:tetrahydromethanopterin S-methyltransferase subunit G
MSENVLQTLQQLVQEVIAPDVRELKVRLTSLEKCMDLRSAALEQKMDARFDAIHARFEALDKKSDARFDAIHARFEALDKKSDARFDSLMSAISESRAQAELTNVRVIASLSERVAVLEAQRH